MLVINNFRVIFLIIPNVTVSGHNNGIIANTTNTLLIGRLFGPTNISQRRKALADLDDMRFRAAGHVQ